MKFGTVFHAVTCQLEINQGRTGKLVDQKVTMVQGVSPSLIESLSHCQLYVGPLFHLYLFSVLVVYLLLF